MLCCVLLALVTLAGLTARLPTFAVRFLKSPAPFFLVAARGPLRLAILAWRWPVGGWIDIAID
jgi:hypothetical protein